MDIRVADHNDLELLHSHDQYVTRAELANSIASGRVYVAERDGALLGCLRYGLFWDNTPFLNLLYFLEEHRRQGNGRELVAFWERQMKRLGCKTLMTSTVSIEDAQHFFVRLGYRAVGGFALPCEPYELLLTKQLDN